MKSATIQLRTPLASRPTVRALTRSKRAQGSGPTRIAASTDLSGQGYTAVDETIDEYTGKPKGLVSQDELDDFLGGLVESQYYEYDYWVDPTRIEGTIPAELSGTYFKNGPGLFEVGGTKIDQPFDGDGMVVSFAFRDGQVFFRNRYVRTKGFVEEQAAGRMLYEGVFSKPDPNAMFTLRNPAALKAKNVANTGVVAWNNRLFAFHESGLPYEMHPLTLDTVGESNMDGTIDGEGPMHAHFRIVNETDGSKRLINFGVGVTGLDGIATFYEYDESMKMVSKTKATLPLGAFGFYHDMVVTENYYVMIENPIRMNFARLLTEYTIGKSSLAECLEYKPEIAPKVHLVPRPGKNGGKEARTMEVDSPFFCFHFSNAYESADGIVVDFVALDEIDFSATVTSLNPEFYDGGARAHMCRLAIDMRDPKQPSIREFRKLANTTCEFPTVNPNVVGKPHKYMYVAASDYDADTLWGPNRAIAKISVNPEAGSSVPLAQAGVCLELFTPGHRLFTQEATFVPRPGGTREDDGWLLTIVQDAEERVAKLYVLAADDLGSGPVAVVALPHHIPNGLHGSWCDRYWGPGQAAPKGWSANADAPPRTPINERVPR